MSLLRVRSASLVIALCLTPMASSCAGSTEKPASSSEQFGDAETSRVKSYDSLSELGRDATIVVVGGQEGGLRVNPYYGDKTTPFAILDLRVDRVVKGKVEAGGVVQVSVEAGLDSEGKIASDKLSADEQYLLYLTPQGPRSPDSYTIVGYVAGAFVENKDGSFGRVDSESPGLPERVTYDEVVAAEN